MLSYFQYLYLQLCSARMDSSRKLTSLVSSVQSTSPSSFSVGSFSCFLPVFTSRRESRHSQREALRVLLDQRQRCTGRKAYRRSSPYLPHIPRSHSYQWDGERDTRGPADFGGEKQQHPGLLVPSAGHDAYDDEDGDGDGDGESADDMKEAHRPAKKLPSPKERRSSTSEEVRYCPVPSFNTYNPLLRSPKASPDTHSPIPLSQHPYLPISQLRPFPSPTSVSPLSILPTTLPLVFQTILILLSVPARKAEQNTPHFLPPSFPIFLPNLPDHHSIPSSPAILPRKPRIVPFSGIYLVQASVAYPTNPAPSSHTHLHPTSLSAGPLPFTCPVQGRTQTRIRIQVPRTIRRSSHTLKLNTTLRSLPTPCFPHLQARVPLPV